MRSSRYFGALQIALLDLAKHPVSALRCMLICFLQGLALETRSAQIDGVLKALLSKLEKEKTTITLGEGDSGYCENFAITVFTRADRADRAGRADKNTAMTFYAASIFFEVHRESLILGTFMLLLLLACSNCC